MKAITTWILLANARHAHVVAHPGLGKGLHVLPDLTWDAEAADLPRDKAGVGHAIAGPGIAAVAQHDPQKRADADFARKVCAGLDAARDQYDRLIIAAGPRMLGLIRSVLSDPLKQSVLGEIPKDLSGQSMAQIEDHVGELLAV